VSRLAEFAMSAPPDESDDLKAKARCHASPAKATRPSRSKDYLTKALPPHCGIPGADVQERRRNVAAVRRKVSRRGSNDAVYGLAGVTREVAETR
jgi:hypothetical protein